MGVGGSFDVVAGRVRRAPRWMQRVGLEWFFRFPQELRRMWKRYLVTNTLFIYYDDVARTKLDEWIYFLKHEEIKDSFKAQGLQEAKDRLDVMKLSEKDRRAFEQYADDLHYQASMFESSYGVGKREGKHEDALKMLEDEGPIDKICRYTGLARELVLELAKKKPPPDKVMEPAADYGRSTRRKPDKSPKGRP